jgi:hypothetical protein
VAGPTLYYSDALDPGSFGSARETPPHRHRCTAGVLEEGLLRAELQGYSDYMARVRYRCIPYLW